MVPALPNVVASGPIKLLDSIGILVQLRLFAGFRAFVEQMENTSPTEPAAA